MEKELRIIISGGGTGGHIFPAVSIANAIKEQCPDAKILFVGAEGRMEMQRVPDAGYEIIGLPVAGFDRKHLWKNFARKAGSQPMESKEYHQKVPSAGSSGSWRLCQWSDIENGRYDGSSDIDTRTEFVCRSDE